MEARDLRIGNLIKEEYSGILQVVAVNSEFGYLDLINPAWEKPVSGRYDIDSVEPIPLSEEWLLKLNAKKLSDGVFTYGRFNVRFLEAYNYWYVIEAIDKAYITKVEFVHEWQNLIFTLDGQELTLNQ